MPPDKTQTCHMHVGQFRRRRINQHLVRQWWWRWWKGNIYPGEGNDVCDKAAILGGEKANKADLTVESFSKTCSRGRTDGGCEKRRPSL